MPGLLNHLTGTLDDIESMKEETKSLMSTIRLPHRLGLITERMPASKYDSDAKHSEESAEKSQMSLKRVSSVPSSRMDDIVSELKEKTRLNAAQKQLKVQKPASAHGLKRSETEKQL